MSLITERHVVVDETGFTELAVFFARKHRPDETIEVDWPEWVRQGLATRGWRTVVEQVEPSQPTLPRAEPPNWLVVAEGLAQSLATLMDEISVPEPDEEDPDTTEFLALWRTARGQLDIYQVAHAEASMVEHRHDFKAGEDPADRCYVCGVARADTLPEPEPEEPDEGEPEDEAGDDGSEASA